MSLLSMLRTTVTLQRSTPAKDASGGATRTWADVGSAVRADVQPASSSTIFRYDQRQMQVSHTIYLSEDVTALTHDRFVDGDGHKFKVMGYHKGPPGYTSWPATADVLEEPQS